MMLVSLELETAACTGEALRPVDDGQDEEAEQHDGCQRMADETRRPSPLDPRPHQAAPRTLDFEGLGDIDRRLAHALPAACQGRAPAGGGQTHLRRHTSTSGSATPVTGACDERVTALVHRSRPTRRGRCAGRILRRRGRWSRGGAGRAGSKQAVPAPMAVCRSGSARRSAGSPQLKPGPDSSGREAAPVRVAGAVTSGGYAWKPGRRRSPFVSAARASVTRHSLTGHLDVVGRPPGRGRDRSMASRPGPAKSLTHPLTAAPANDHRYSWGPRRRNVAD
jgi:hypothetical protein